MKTKEEELKEEIERKLDLIGWVGNEHLRIELRKLIEDYRQEAIRDFIINKS
jgi:hypothetical protein